MVYSKLMGARVRRKEDPRLITGRSTYVGDVRLLDIGHVAFLRSTQAHARIVGIDTAAAAALPGVIAVLTGAELQADFKTPMPHGGEGAGGEDMAAVDTPVLETERVRHVGQALAVVVAENPGIAQDAMELIEVDYEPLPVVVDLEAAIAPGAPQLYDQAPGNVAFTYKRKRGPADAAFAEAEVVVRRKMVNQRLAGIPLEPRGVLAQPDALSGGLVVTTSTQNPHSVRTQIAGALGLPEIAVRVVAPEVGGGFGVKISTYPEEIVLAALALRLRRPVKWVETRRENFLATHHGRAQIADLEIAARKDGTITGLRLRGLADLGAYPRDPTIPPLTGWLLCGVYKIPAIDFEIKAVYTNTMAVGAYRGAGRPEAAYFIERMVDILAAELAMDPVEIRRKNFIPKDLFPYKTPNGPTYDTGEYDKALSRVLELADYPALRAEQQRLRAEGRYLGIGVTVFTEVCGFGPYDSATVRVEPTGSVTVTTGISPHGQGQETTFAQIVADQLGVSMDDVVVVHGDTARTPAGIGTMGSRGLVVGGSALVRALETVQAQAIKAAAHLLEAAPEDVELRDGAFGVIGAPDRVKTLAEIAVASYAGELPDSVGTGLEAVHFFRPDDMTFPFGADVVVVEVEVETGLITLRRYVTVDDCGNVISPVLVEGQVHGGLAQGIGQALFEEVIYDAAGQLLTGSLMDYAVPKAHLLIDFQTDHTVTTTPLNPLGSKGIGELATIGSTPAIVNAVVDALAPFGIRHLDMPLRPAKIWQAIREARASGTA
ncbi:MAG: xanthine dehydrogenase family protein molybdopterin-binding subunit [Chloroflexota bacterium]